MMTAKHTIMIGGDDGKVYRITSDQLKAYQVSDDEAHIGKMKSRFASGLTHHAVPAGTGDPDTDPPNCYAAASADEHVHFLNLSTSAGSE